MPYNVIKKLGDGGYGQVFLVQDAVSGEQFAIKLFDPEISSKEDIEKEFYTGKAMSKLLKDGVPKMYKIIDQFTYDNLVRSGILMEYLPGVTLDEFFNEEVSTDVSISIILMIAYYIYYLHYTGFVLRDLKFDNIIINIDKDKLSRLSLIDFFSVCHKNEIEKLVGCGIHICGTPGYAPADMWNDLGNFETSKKADVFSLGMMLYFIFGGEDPLPQSMSVDEYLEAVKNNQFYEKINFDTIPDPIRILLEKMLSKDPNRRPKIENVIKYLSKVLEIIKK